MKIGLPPIAPADARLFILGSLPGEASLAAQRYYAHPTNQFWRLLGIALDEDLTSLEYAERLERLADRKVGLWDVIASARRSTSLDQDIRDARHNAIERLPDDFPEVRAIAFNGGTAMRIGSRILNAHEGDVELIALPSSSAAFTRPFADKAADWAKIGQWAGPKRLRSA